MSENERRPGSAKRQILHGTNLAIYIVVVLAIIVLCNWFVNRNDHHLDLTPNKEFSLSPQTRKLLKGLDRPVSIYVFERESGFRERRDLMNLYSSASHLSMFNMSIPTGIRGWRTNSECRITDRSMWPRAVIICRLQTLPRKALPML